MKKLIECVPNFSEGRNQETLEAIKDAIQAVGGAKLLDMDPGKATNRTVVTIVGEPEAVIEAAYQAIKTAGDKIDMSKHSGEHARMGATDVCPLIPVANITMEETAEWAIKLAKRVGDSTDIPVYLYGAAQKRDYRKDLSVIRAGEYEGFFDKIQKEEWKPDFGPSVMNAKKGATVIGARDFLIAYNINLNSTSTRLANRVAFDVREAGRVKREGNPYTGKIIRDEEGETLRIPGSCKEVKAVGWFIDEYGIAQISANLTNINVTPMHVFFEEVDKSCIKRGLRITGSELVGLVPLKAMLDAGKYFLEKQGRSLGVSELELIKIAIKSMGLDELGSFDPEKKIIEYQLRNASEERLVSMTCKEFANETASESMAPGGGSVAALVGSFGASLSTMVANLSANKRGWEDKIDHFSAWAQKGQSIKDRLLFLVDEDTRSFEGIIEAIRMPKESDEEKLARKKAIELASQYATKVPLEVMKVSYSMYTLVEEMIAKGNPNSITDAGVGALCAFTAMEGAFMNVKVNAKDLTDTKVRDEIVHEANTLLANGKAKVEFIRERVYQELG